MSRPQKNLTQDFHELNQRLKELQIKLSKTRLNVSLKKEKNYHLVRSIKQEIARLKAKINELAESQLAQKIKDNNATGKS